MSVGNSRGVGAPIRSRGMQCSRFRTVCGFIGEPTDEQLASGPLRAAVVESRQRRGVRLGAPHCTLHDNVLMLQPQRPH